MENRKEFHFLSSDGKTQLHAVTWLPEGEAVGILQIAHGVAEYALRYDDFARFMTTKGFIVTANDHLGHGQSVREGAPRLFFAESGGWDYAVRDLYALRDLTGKAYPGLPYFLLGHSMGSFLTRSYLIRYPGTVDGAIVMGTGQVSTALLRAGSALAGLIAKKSGRSTFSPTVEGLAFGSYNKPFAPERTKYDWLSVNEENVDRYIADPLCGGEISTGLFLDMFGGMRAIQNPSALRSMNRTTPVFFIAGAQDPVGDMGKGVKAAYESFRKVGVQDVELKLYEGLRHEILNESCREEVYDDLWGWISRHLS